MKDQANAGSAGALNTLAGSRTKTFLAPLSAPGLLIAAIFFGLSMTPSMVPRAPELQGVLGGIVAGIGYLMWVAAVQAVFWLRQMPPARPRRVVRSGALVAAAGVAGWGLWQGAEWQDTIKRAWGLPSVDASAPATTALIAVTVFAVLLLVGRVFLVDGSG